MKVDRTKVGLVRGVVIYSQWGSGRIGIEDAKDENNVCVGVAYTMWHRHDENPSVVERELERLGNLYTSFDACDAAMMGFEYKEYKQ